MNSSRNMIVPLAVWATVTCFSSGVAPAQTLQITSPADGTVVHPGQVLTVTVSASPETAFREVVVIGQSPIGFTAMRTAPPYTFSLHIPSDIRPRRYSITADGTPTSGGDASSDPVDLDVERSDLPISLTCEPSTLDFGAVGDGIAISPIGTFGGDRVDLRESSYVRYASEDPRVASVKKDGFVTAVGVGSTRVVISYRGMSLTIPLKVRGGGR